MRERQSGIKTCTTCDIADNNNIKQYDQTVQKQGSSGDVLFLPGTQITRTAHFPFYRPK